jgi:hypothetical protein
MCVCVCVCVCVCIQHVQRSYTVTFPVLLALVVIQKFNFLKFYLTTYMNVTASVNWAT